MSKSNSFVKITKWTLVFIGSGLGLMSKFSTWRFILKSCLIGASLIALFTKKLPQPDVAQILNRETDTSFFKSDWELRASYLRNGREFYECFLISENDVDTVDFSVLSSDVCPDFDATYQRWLDLLNRSYRYTKLFPKDVYEDYCIKYTNPTEKYMWAYFQSVALREIDEETGERKTGYYKNKYPNFKTIDSSLDIRSINYYLVLYEPENGFIEVATTHSEVTAKGDIQIGSDLGFNQPSLM